MREFLTATLHYRNAFDNISLQDYHYINKSAQRGLGKSEFPRRKVEVSSDESRTLLGGKSERAYRA